jgi:acyl-CoA dehydrogenase
MRQITRMSSGFALISDFSMALLGGKLKRREKLTGRLADALAWMYLASASIKRFNDEGRKTDHLPFFQWSCEHAMYNVQTALTSMLDNFPNRFVAQMLKILIFPLGKPYREPSDQLGALVSRSLLEDHAGRIDLSSDIYVPDKEELGLGRMEAALKEATLALAVEAKIRDAVRAGHLDKAPGDELLVRAYKSGIITKEERDEVLRAERIRDEVIQVDAFTPEAYRSLHG